MGSVILISTVAVLVAIVGCFFIWRVDASRAEEIEHTSPPAPAPGTSTALPSTDVPTPGLAPGTPKPPRPLPGA